MNHRRLGALVLVLVVGLGLTLARAPSAAAWDYFGHDVVGAVAWEGMDDATRAAVVELLLEAPPDADLASLLPPASRPREVRQWELFVKAQGWGDLVRDELWPERKAKYDHPAWHYVNRFWTEGPAGPRMLEERGTAGELVVRLEQARRELLDASRDSSDRALALAWTLHLVGDVHQPLHSSARVTALEPDGDRGGNDFLLDDVAAPNLHAFWDSILGRARRQRHRELYFAWVRRVADEITRLHPRESFAAELSIDSADEWSKEGVAIAMRAAYPSDLVRGAAPPPHYADDVFEQASRQAALAGYRLARLLNESFSARR